MTDDELRDDFGDELADALRMRSSARERAVPPVAVTRPVPSRRNRHGLTGLVAVGLAAAVVIVIAMTRPGPRHIRVATAPPSTSTLSSFAPLVLDWTWVSAEHGWALLRTPCASSTCVTLRETRDGAKTWMTLPTPDPSGCADPGCFSNVRFANANVGWLFGPDLFQTSDGGHTWTSEESATVTDVEAAHGIAMRASTTDRLCSDGCDHRVDRLRLGSSSWQRLRLGPQPLPHLLLQGSDAYVFNTAVLFGAGAGDLRRSSDGGATWSRIDDPCPRSDVGSRADSASAAPGGVLVVLCEVRGVKATVQVSTDGGDTFGRSHEIPDAPVDAGPIAAASADTIAVAYNAPDRAGVLVSNDGGTTWRRTLSPTRAATIGPSLGWQDATTARASFNTDSIWTTRDGGRSWTEDRVGP